MGHFALEFDQKLQFCAQICYNFQIMIHRNFERSSNRMIFTVGMELGNLKIKLEVAVQRSDLSLDVFLLKPFLLEPYYPCVTLHLIM